MSDPKCEGCGERPEVHGSSWCSHCSSFLPRYVQERLLTMRNTLIDIGHRSSMKKREMQDAAVAALTAQTENP